MPNVFLPAEDTIRISPELVYKLVSTRRDREAILEALAEFDKLNAHLRDLRVIDRTRPARAALEAAGIETLSDADYSLVYLERMAAPGMIEQVEYNIGCRIEARLMDKCQPVLRAIRRAAAAELSTHLGSVDSTAREVARRYGLPAALAVPPVYRYVEACKADIEDGLRRGDWIPPIGPAKRLSLGNFFAAQL